MAQQKFNLKIGGIPENKGNNAADELRKIEAKKDFNFQIIPYEKIIPNPMNDYPMVELEELSESIDKNGLIHILKLIPVGDGTFRILSGERRYRALGIILSKGEEIYKSANKYKNGIPCMLEDSTLNEIDEEIRVIVANEDVRERDEAFRRKKIERLNELYRIKNEESGNKQSITKKISQDLNIGERQVQRYNAVNQKLIPELQEAFDNSKLTLEKAAQFAALDEATQKILVDLLDYNKSINKDEIELIKKAAEKKEKELLENIDILNKTAIESNKKNDKLLQELNKKEEVLVKNREKEKSIRSEIEEELKENNPDQKKLDELNNQIDKMKKEAYEIECEKEDVRKQLDQQQKEINSLRKELQQAQKTQKDDKFSILSPDEKNKLKESFEITNIISDIKKNMNQLFVKSESFEKKYKESIAGEEVYNEIIQKAQTDKSKLLNK